MWPRYEVRTPLNPPTGDDLRNGRCSSTMFDKLDVLVFLAGGHPFWKARRYVTKRIEQRADRELLELPPPLPPLVSSLIPHLTGDYDDVHSSQRLTAAQSSAGAVQMASVASPRALSPHSIFSRHSAAQASASAAARSHHSPAPLPQSSRAPSGAPSMADSHRSAALHRSASLHDFHNSAVLCQPSRAPSVAGSVLSVGSHHSHHSAFSHRSQHLVASQRPSRAPSVAGSQC